MQEAAELQVSVLRVQGVPKTQSVATRTPPAQRYAGEGGFRVGMTIRVSVANLSPLHRANSLDINSDRGDRNEGKRSEVYKKYFITKGHLSILYKTDYLAICYIIS